MMDPATAIKIDKMESSCRKKTRLEIFTRTNWFSNDGVITSIQSSENLWQKDGMRCFRHEAHRLMISFSSSRFNGLVWGKSGWFRRLKDCGASYRSGATSNILSSGIICVPGLYRSVVVLGCRLCSRARLVTR